MSLDWAVSGSFRDPAGRVHEREGRIFRTVTKSGAPAFVASRDSGFLDRLVDEGRLVPFDEISDPHVAGLFPNAEYVLEHPRLEMISYPYEWSFGQLRAAALFHLELALDALQAGFTLSDSTAYNVQFIGHRPIFIDHLSFHPYREGEFWVAHQQFCEQFLNPLLLRAIIGIPHNAWYRGGLEGIPTDQIVRLLPLSSRFSLRMNAHVFLPARFQKGTQADALRAADNKSNGRQLPKRGYEGLLRQLHRWIASLRPKGANPSVWADYADDNTYSSTESATKKQIVHEFAAARRPGLIIDLGCNSGFFSETALAAGASAAVGFDFDQDSLDRAFQRAVENAMPFTPLFLDAANPSPMQGWAQAERTGFETRARGDAVMALAFIHHLAIAKNVPLDQVVEWLVARAPVGLIEFIPKSDPTVQSMLRVREDIFDNYHEEAFQAALSVHARIVNTTLVSSSGRVIYEFERRA
jgi:ribosomal protein L11 methylase PrmA